MKRSFAAAAIVPMAVLVIPGGCVGGAESVALPPGASQGGFGRGEPGKPAPKLLLSRDTRAGRGDVRLGQKRD